MMKAFLTRVLGPEAAGRFITETIPPDGGKNCYEVVSRGDQIALRGDCPVSIAMALNAYLTEVCRVNYSWNGNRQIRLTEYPPVAKPLRRTVDQKYRVYMNYCTLCYSMAWWGWERWEKEIDFMAMKGINMPLAVVGTEKVWFDTLTELGLSREESLRCISGPAFWAWQLMTNIDSYMPPSDEKYVEERAALGKKIMERYLEWGMFPIQQGYSGHLPMIAREKFPHAKIQAKAEWCDFPATAQLDPTDPLFPRIGRIFLEKQDALFGSHHFYACDPFHEGTPPQKRPGYLKKVARAIDQVYRDFDPDGIWVMQSWSLRRGIVRAVDRSRLLILDIDGNRAKNTHNFWKYPFVSGHLHNFGGKNSLHGDLDGVAENAYARLKRQGANVVGTGLFPEGIEQNPVYYDLVFDIGTRSGAVDADAWLRDYVRRRYGAESAPAQEAWTILKQSCYHKNTGYEEETGSIICCRPAMHPRHAAPNDKLIRTYDNALLIHALQLLLAARGELAASDGYQFDVCDLTRQILSNRALELHSQITALCEKRDIPAAEKKIAAFLTLLEDVDTLVSHRSELTLARWINDAHRLATDPAEEKYYDKCARTLITLWGDIGRDPALCDYAWREWGGLIREYYLPRWRMYYDSVLENMKNGRDTPDNTPGGQLFFDRPRTRAAETGRKLSEFEYKWTGTPCSYPEPLDTDVLPCVDALVKKYGLFQEE